ncbi:hypothetical protein [Microbacterium sp. UFMG61]|uniref:hypothetical protein n=1 Tax=Microbacterium sp. UFMG61 TaxID=2745935 RepID=UPI00188E8063|nr:hypothetical protein [Microbacterium sp. UFMG61]
MSASPIPSILRRSTSWFFLAGAGNIAILFAVFIIGMPPLSGPYAESLQVISTFAMPMYAPELLIFTSIPALLSGLRADGASGSERDEAVRLIAWAVRVALTFVLMFAVPVVAVTPEMLSTVLFAVLLAFVTFVLAERLDPPVPASIEMRIMKADRDLALRESRATEALGRNWHEDTTRWWWAIIALFILAPVAVQTIAGTVVAVFLWGPQFALSGEWIVVPLLTSYGSVILTFAWLSTADKTDSPQARAWRGTAFAALAGIASVIFAAVFFVARGDSAPIGMVILTTTALHGAALWIRTDWWGRRLLHRVSATLTSRRLERLTRGYAAVYLAWDDDQSAKDADSAPTSRWHLFRRRG